MFGIIDLDQKHQSMNPAGLYVTTGTTDEISIGYLKCLLDSDPESTFISMVSLYDLFKNKNADQKNELKEHLCEHDAYFLSKNKSNLSLNKLKKDIHRINIKRNTNTVFYVSDNTLLTAKESDRLSFFIYLKQLSLELQSAICIVISGQESHRLSHWLMTHPGYLLGLSSIHQTDSAKYVYQIHFWISAQNISAHFEYDILLENSGKFGVNVAEHNEKLDNKQKLHDGRFLYIAESAIDTNQSGEHTMVKFDNNQALFDQLDNITSGTVILTISQQSEAHQLALNCYRLRRKFGLEFKIVVRELQQCLRYSDESFLTHAGINLIVPSSVRYARFLSMVETLQKQDITYKIADSVETLINLESNAGYGHKGYVDNHRFVARCHNLIEQYEHSQLQFALVKLSLLPGIDLHSCLRMCHIKRDGDLITACNDALYVLLASVRHNDVDIALSRIFKLPIMDIFQSNTIYTTIGRMKTQLPEIVTQAVVIDANSASLTVQDSIFTPNTENDKPSDIHYAIHKPMEQ